MNLCKKLTSKSVFLITVLCVCASLGACSDDAPEKRGSDRDLTDISQEGDTSDAEEPGDTDSEDAADSDSTDDGTCPEGFVDLNGDPEDGCECATTDPIDAAGLDENCDGVDGILAETVFVSPTGDDGNDGLEPQSAVKTIQQGLQVAASAQRTVVQLAAGSYDEVVELKNGISLYGGYGADFGARDVEATPSKIVAGEVALNAADQIYITMTADQIAEATVLDGVSVYGVDATVDGASTVALWATNSAGLSIQNARLIGGVAADGTAGADGADAANCANNAGGDGGAALESQKPCDSSTYPNASPGNSGEQFVYSDDGDSSNDYGTGGAGGTHHCETIIGPGAAGAGAVGRVGKAGEDGADGELAAAGEVGHFDASNRWIPATGVAPTAGEAGGGGGGGGAGGNYQNTAAGPVLKGGNGGKGGDGGCGGDGAENGHAGATSFGLVVVDAPIELINIEVVLGKGGDGGDGGDGGAKGNGEPGATGNMGEISETGSGGDGGWGGNGGDGGDGVGGQGGNAFGIATIDATVDAADVTYDQAEAGAGNGGVGAGADANDGIIETMRVF